MDPASCKIEEPTQHRKSPGRYSFHEGIEPVSAWPRLSEKHCGSCNPGMGEDAGMAPNTTKVWANETAAGANEGHIRTEKPGNLSGLNGGIAFPNVWY